LLAHASAFADSKKIARASAGAASVCGDQKTGRSTVDFQYGERVEALRRRVQDFMDSYVVPANPEWHAETRQGRYPLRLLDERKALAKEEGLWNLFLPGLAAG
jgi:hypothetical protein